MILILLILIIIIIIIQPPFFPFNKRPCWHLRVRASAQELPPTKARRNSAIVQACCSFVWSSSRIFLWKGNTFQPQSALKCPGLLCWQSKSCFNWYCLSTKTWKISIKSALSWCPFRIPFVWNESWASKIRPLCHVTKAEVRQAFAWVVYDKPGVCSCEENTDNMIILDIIKYYVYIHDVIMSYICDIAHLEKGQLFEFRQLLEPKPTLRAALLHRWFSLKQLEKLRLETFRDEYSAISPTWDFPWKQRPLPTCARTTELCLVSRDAWHAEVCMTCADAINMEIPVDFTIMCIQSWSDVCVQTCVELFKLMSFVPFE